jgi:hypothetical protein
MAQSVPASFHQGGSHLSYSMHDDVCISATPRSRECLKKRHIPLLSRKTQQPKDARLVAAKRSYDRSSAGKDVCLAYRFRKSTEKTKKKGRPMERQEIFSFLRTEQVDALSDAAEVIKLKEGEVVYRKGAKPEFFFVILSGEVALRLPGKGEMSILVDEISDGTMFGSCVCLALDSYICTAQCAKDSALLKIRTSVLKELLDDHPRRGYAIQSRISQIYFKRYMETMKKLQVIAMNIPLETKT